MNIVLDTAAGALYLRLMPGRVAETAELADLVVADYDDAGRMLGVEFVRARRFGPFLHQHPEVAALPSRLPYASLDRGVSWELETGADQRSDVDRVALNIELNAAFIEEALANPWLLDRLPQGAAIIPLRVGAPHLSADEALGLAQKVAREGRAPVLQPLGLPSPERSEWVKTQIPNIRYRELSPKWPAGMGEAPPTLHYYPDTDLLVFNLVPGRDARPELGRVVPISDPAFGILLIDLETEIVVGRLVPRFVSSVLQQYGETRAWLDLVQLRSPTPIELAHVLEDLGFLTRTDDVQVEGVTGGTVARTG